MSQKTKDWIFLIVAFSSIFLAIRLVMDYFQLR